ncbi:MAG: glycosyltransferase [bacterium]
MSIRLLYLTCTELVANYGIFDTQVKSLLKALAARNRGSLVVHLYSLVSVLRFTKKSIIEIVFYRYKESFRALRQEMSAVEICARVRPLLSAYPFDTWRLLEMALALPLAVAMLLLYVRRHHINLLHCRSYHAGLLGLIMRKLAGVPYIFDPRSLWIEEQILSGKWPRTSWTCHTWKRLEKAIVRHAAACVVVSDPMQESFTSDAQRVEVIYTTAGEMHFADLDASQMPQEVRVLERLKNSHSLFVFNAGNFNRWNNLDHLLSRYKELCRMVPHAVLVIITRTPREQIERSLAVHAIAKDRVVIMALESHLVPAVLRKCDYGLLVRPRSSESPREISVKFPEYLAAGLPVICDEYIGGAAYVIERHQVGILLTNDWSRNKTELACLEKTYETTSKQCRQIARELFSVNVHADRYAALYQEALA